MAQKLCEQVRFDLEEFVREDFALRLPLEIMIHMSTCSECQRYKDQLIILNKQIQSALSFQPSPAGFTDQIVAFVKQSADSKTEDLSWIDFVYRAFIWSWSAMVVIVLAGLLSSYFGFGQFDLFLNAQMAVDQVFLEISTLFYHASAGFFEQWNHVLELLFTLLSRIPELTWSLWNQNGVQMAIPFAFICLILGWIQLVRVNKYFVYQED